MSNSNSGFSIRDAAAGVDPLFVQRWSPRVFGKEPVPAADLAVMLDAARWSPSCYNEQPWRFYTATAQSYDQFLSLLVEGNQGWAVSAPVIGFVVAKRQFAHNGRDNAHAVFDTGSAWMAFNLQASLLGYHVHGMAGIHYDRVYAALGLDPDCFQVVCGFVVGKADARASETITGRLSLAELWTEV